MGTPTLRLATPDDVQAVGELVGAFRDHLGADEPSDATLAATLPAGLADPGVEIVLALGAGDEALGYAHSRFSHSIWAAGPAAHLEDLYVREAHRDSGLGLRLIEFAMERAVSRGARTLTFHTNERNTGAQAFYRRLGFRPQTEPAWDGGYEVFWSRPLPPRG